MADVIKQLLCNHEYEFVGTVHTLWENDNKEVIPIRTDLLECKHCEKRTVLYQHEYLTGQHFRDYMKLWKRHQFTVPQEWFKMNKEDDENTRITRENK